VTRLAETLTILGELDQLPRCSAWVVEAGKRLELPDSIMFSLDLCFEEALSNIMLYGLKHAQLEDQEILIRMVVEGGSLWVFIEDRGAPFDPTAAPDHEQPGDLDHAKIGGLGILLLRKFTKGMSYDRQNSRNRLTLEFGLNK